MRNRTFLFSLCSALTLVVTLAGAQPPAPAANAKTVLTRPLAEAMTKKARELFSDGMQAAAQGKLADARAAFIGADALSPHYSNMCNLGDVELRLGTFVDAATHLRTCANGLQGDAKATAAEREGAKKLYETAKSKVAELAITASVNGAKIVVDGAAVGTAPLAESVFAEPGKMTVSATLDGYESAKVEVDAKVGVVVPVGLVLTKVAPVGSATAAPSGTATVLPAARSNTIVIGGAALAGAAVVLGGVLVGLAEKSRGDLIAETPKNADGSLVCAKQSAPGTAEPACDDLRDRMRAGNALGQGGVALLIAGGLIGLGTAGYAILRPVAQKTSATTWAPVVTPSSAGLVCTGKF